MYATIQLQSKVQVTAIYAAMGWSMLSRRNITPVAQPAQVPIGVFNTNGERIRLENIHGCD